MRAAVALIEIPGIGQNVSKLSGRSAAGESSLVIYVNLARVIRRIFGR